MRTLDRFGHFHQSRQRGVVLIVALVLLLVLTVLGAAGVRDTTMEEKMAGNFRDLTAAFEAAEAALRTGEQQVANTTVFGAMAFDGSDGTYDVSVMSHSVMPSMVDDDDAWIALNTNQMDKDHTLLSADPEFYIEKLPSIELPGSNLAIGTQNVPFPLSYYRVTARGRGISPNSEVILQSTLFDWNGN
ncbi:MAG: pilus assembly protein [Gammaproteobacteria bacterium]|nr:pilus assembly protein [Gammaproteobacteria bacterium]